MRKSPVAVNSDSNLSYGGYVIIFQQSYFYARLQEEGCLFCKISKKAKILINYQHNAEAAFFFTCLISFLLMDFSLF